MMAFRGKRSGSGVLHAIGAGRSPRAAARECASMARTRSGLLAAVMLFALLLVGCGEHGTGGEAGNTAGADLTEPRVRAIVNRTTASVGEPLEVTVEAISSPSVTATIPDPPETVGAFRVRRASAPVATLESGRRVTTRRFTLVGLEAGEQELPAFEAIFTDAAPSPADAAAPDSDAGPIRRTTEPVPVALDTTLEGEFDPRVYADVKPAATLPEPMRWPWYLAGALLAAAALAGMTAMVVRRAHRQPPPLPPHRWALAELDRLESSGAVDAGGLPFVVQLTDILRTYIERRFHVMAPEQTTEEFLRVAQSHPALATAHATTLNGLLRTADLVKFAKQHAPRESCRAALEATRRFVEETVPLTEQQP